MAYIGQGIKQGTFKVLDTSGNTYNGSNVTFSLGTQVGSAAQLLVSHDGVIQKAGTDYTLATGGTQITFSTAPASGASIFITEISGAVGGTVTPSDASVTSDKIADTAVTSAKLNSAFLTGHTDIGANIADADLFLTDDGAGGTLRKTAASRLKTYVGAGAGAFDIANLDIDGGTDIGADIADSDLFIIDDGAGGTNRKTAASRLKTYIGGGVTLLGSIESTSDASTIAIDSVMDETSYAYYIVAGLFKSGGNGATIEARFRDGGSALTASVYNFSNLRWEAGESSPQLSTGASSNHADIVDGVGTRVFSFYGHVFPCTSIANMGVSICDWSGKISAYASGSRNIRKVSGVFEFVNTTVPDGFQIVNQTANFEDYEMRIYGVTR